MATSKPVPMDRKAVKRITAAATKITGGKIPAKSFASVADATVQRREAEQKNKKH